MIEKIERYLKKTFGENSHRFEHIMNVKKVAVMLAEIHNLDENKVIISALLHDATKSFSHHKNLEMIKDDFSVEDIKALPASCLHAYSASVLAKNVFGIVDEEILNAIKYHCAGRPKMSKLEQIIFVSDFIEEGRDFVDDEIKELAKTNLTKATYEIMIKTKEYLIKNNRVVAQTTEIAIEEYKKELEELNDR